MHSLFIPALLLSMIVLLTGCPKPQPEILPRNQLLQQHNNRAEQFVRLWSECRISIRMPREFDDQGRPAPGTGYRTESIDGNFILRKPRDLYLEGRFFGSRQFGLHSNQAMYWLYIRPQDIEYVGRYGGPGIEQFPMRPDQLLRGLGIYTVGEGEQMLAFRRGDEMDVLQVLRTYTAADLQRISRDGFGPIYIAEEIYLDRFEHLPAQVRLYDLAGDILVQSNLSEYRKIAMHPQIELTDDQLMDDPFALPEVDRSTVLAEISVAHKIVFDLPSRGTTVTLTLKNVDISLELDDEVFRYQPSPVERRIDLDDDAAPADPDSPPDDAPPLVTTAGRLKIPH